MFVYIGESLYCPMAWILLLELLSCLSFACQSTTTRSLALRFCFRLMQQKPRTPQILLWTLEVHGPPIGDNWPRCNYLKQSTLSWWTIYIKPLVLVCEIFVLQKHTLSCYFCTTLQLHNSSDDCTRELSKHSVCLSVCNEKN